METKFCVGCGVDRPIDQFNFKNKRRGKRQVRCRFCTRLQVRRHYENNHDYYVRKAMKRKKKVKTQQHKQVLIYLSMHPCIDCGEADPVCLDFDHVRGEKVAPVSKMVGTYEWSSIEAEIAKCEVRCANCHRRKTGWQRGYYRLLLKE
jgi:hypothetical protein